MIHTVKSDSWEQFDQDDAKEMFADFSEEFLCQLLARMALEQSGYRVHRTRIETIHPVLRIDLVRTTAPRITDDVKLVRHFWKILKSHGVSLARKDLLLSRSGDRIQLNFLLESPLR